MSDFIGARDVVLHASGAESSSGQGAFFEVEANLYRIDLTVSAESGADKTIEVKTETGYVAASFTVADTTPQSLVIKTGSIPGGRRLQAVWTVPGGADVTFALTASETQTG